MQPILAEHYDRPEFKDATSRGIDTVLASIPDGDEIRDQLYRAITDSVEGAIEKANRQIRETKRTFNIPDAYGLLVLLNDAILILPPTTVGKRVANCFMKTTDEGRRRFADIDAAWLLNERHVIDVAGRRALTDLIIPSTKSDRSKYASSVADLLTEQWAAFNKKPFVRASDDLIAHLRFRGKPKS